VYCPFALMVPAPEFASPPEIVQFTLAVPPLNDAENCSTNPPDVVVVLHPVQLASMVAVPGEIERLVLGLEEPLTNVPPQPARTNIAGSSALASTRPGHRRKKRILPCGPPGFEILPRPTVMPSVFRFSPLGVFLAVFAAQLAFSDGSQAAVDACA
jgi:hypothetical protein